MSRRMEKVADQLQVEIADLLQREVKHPALSGVMISITTVEVSPDLATARVFVSVMQRFDAGDDVEAPAESAADASELEAEAMVALQRTEPFIHHELMKRLRMRQVPRMRFFADHSIAEGSRITSLMREVAHSEGREL
jgi:ribosome-binding factor A